VQRHLEGLLERIGGKIVDAYFEARTRNSPLRVYVSDGGLKSGEIDGD
jgi:pyridoxine/pyridoxamine 5'-phosphate oxidase